VAVSFIGGGNRSTRRKPPQVTDKLDYIMKTAKTANISYNE
jgi:hypothetical protein